MPRSFWNSGEFLGKNKRDAVTTKRSQDVAVKCDEVAGNFYGILEQKKDFTYKLTLTL